MDVRWFDVGRFNVGGFNVGWFNDVHNSFAVVMVGVVMMPTFTGMSVFTVMSSFAFRTNSIPSK
jgi:hypothetical protein